MIFLTVGTQLSFDRLVRIVDELIPSVSRPIYGQIGPNPKYLPRNFAYSNHLGPVDFDQHVSQADLIVSHAGIGSILAARRVGKPIVVFPRLASQGEHRNDHQLATCRQMEHVSGIMVAWNGEDLASLLRDPGTYVAPDRQLASRGRQDLERALRAFMLGTPIA